LLHGAFWYLQHKTWVLDRKDLAVYNNVCKKIKKEYPFFIRWLEEQYEQKTNKSTTWVITEDSTWDTVKEKYFFAASDFSDEAQTDQLEAILKVPGGGYVDVDDEEVLMSSVCRISLEGKQCDGVFVNLFGHLGILASTKLLKSKEDCQNAKVFFESQDDTFENISLNPEVHYFVNDELDIIFVGSKFDKVTPLRFKNNYYKNKKCELQKNKEVSCVIYYFAKKEKLQLACKITKKVESKLTLSKKTPSSGCPLFVEDTFAGFLRTDKLDQANDFKPCYIWLYSKFAKVGDEVKAKWVDNYYYPASVLEQTQKGFKVHFYEYGEGDENKIEVDENSIQPPETKEKEGSESNQTKENENSTQPASSGYKSNNISDEKESSTQPTSGESELSDKMIKWLEQHKFEKKMQFFKNDDLNTQQKLVTLKNKDQLRDKLKEHNFNHGLMLKVEKVITALVAYDRVEESNFSQAETKEIKEILNTPMDDTFKPDKSKNELDLNEQFKDSNGNISIRSSLQNIIEGKFYPKGVTSKQPYFYLRSTKHKRYFKIELVFSD